MWLWAGLAWAGKWDGVPSDVLAERTLAVPVAAAFAAFTDLELLGAARDSECVSEWVVASPARGAGARVTVRYSIGVVRRRVPAVLTNVIPDRSIDLEHEGKRGFTTRFALEAVGDTTRVTSTTFLTAPPWPATAYYHRRVKPAWEACQAAMLSGVAVQLGVP